jgi:broad specificity phosphatase PhoE
MTVLESLSFRISSTVRTRIERELTEVLSLNDEDAAELMLVRHAETPVCQQPVDEFDRGARLSRTGVEQARRLARRLQSLWVEQIYFAPEQRTEETAEILSDILRCPAACVPDLRDIGFDLRLQEQGIALCDGASAAESFIAHPRWDALPGFEASRSFRLRVVLALESLLSQHPGRRILIVTHSSLINAYLSMVLDIPRDMFFAPEPTSVSVVRSHNDLYAVRAINDTAHLVDA